MATGEISADAVTGDLRTRSNSLSFWRCDTATKSEIDDAVLAIAAAGDRLDKVDIVWLEASDMRTNGNNILQDSKGQTPVSDLVDRHVDIVGIDYVRLGRIAHRVSTAIAEGQSCRVTRSNVRKLLILAVERGRVSLEDFTGRLKSEIQKSVPPPRRSTEDQSD